MKEDACYSSSQSVSVNGPVILITCLGCQKQASKQRVAEKQRQPMFKHLMQLLQVISYQVVVSDSLVRLGTSH